MRFKNIGTGKNDCLAGGWEKTDHFGDWGWLQAFLHSPALRFQNKCLNSACYIRPLHQQPTQPVHGSRGRGNPNSPAARGECQASQTLCGGRNDVGGSSQRCPQLCRSSTAYSSVVRPTACIGLGGRPTPPTHRERPGQGGGTAIPPPPPPRAERGPERDRDLGDGLGDLPVHGARGAWGWGAFCACILHSFRHSHRHFHSSL